MLEGLTPRVHKSVPISGPRHPFLRPVVLSATITLFNIENFAVTNERKILQRKIPRNVLNSMLL